MIYFTVKVTLIASNGRSIESRAVGKIVRTDATATDGYFMVWILMKAEIIFLGTLRVREMSKISFLYCQLAAKHRSVK